MCGFAGILSTKQFEIKKSTIFEIFSTIDHRGNDSIGFFEKKNNENFTLNTAKNIYNLNLNYKYNSNYYLFHKRLSILDLNSSSDQPFTDYFNKYIIVFNGEIYNFKSVREELKLNGVKFKTDSDTEVILNGYKIWGTEIVKKLEGMFAFAIIDLNKNICFLTRDTFGIKPLYWYFNNDEFIFSSEIQTLLKLKKNKIEKQNLINSFVFGSNLSPSTNYKNIYSLEPSHGLIVNLNNSKIIKKIYYKCYQFDKTIYNNNIKKNSEIFINLFNESLKENMTSDVEVAHLLSSGTDSSLIAFMLKKNNYNFKTFNLNSSENYFKNEGQDTSKFAKFLNINHKNLLFDINDVGIDDIENIFKIYDNPFYAISSNYFLFKKLKNIPIKVFLSGIGADELFSGYKYYNYISIFNNIKKILLLFDFKKTGIFHPFERIFQVVRSKNPIELINSFRMILSDRELSLLFKTDVKALQNISEITNNNLDIKDNKFTSQITLAEVSNYLNNHQLERVDKFSMFFTKEVRVPFLSKKIFNFAINLPRNQKYSFFKRKTILSYTLNKLVNNKFKFYKKGFDIPTEYILEKKFDCYFKKKISNLKQYDFLNKDYIDKIIIEWRKNYRSYRGVLLLVSLENWLKRNAEHL